MTNEPRKKGLKARLFSSFGTQRDLKDPQGRAGALATALREYLDTYKAGKDSLAARAHLDVLAAEYRTIDQPTLSIYHTAFRANAADLDLLRFLVGEYEAWSADDTSARDAVEAYWALAVAEPNDLTHYYRLISHYRAVDDPLTLITIEERIIDRMWAMMQSGDTASTANPANREIYALALEDLSHHYIDMGRFDAKALQIFEGQFALHPQDDLVLATLATAYRQMGRTDARAVDVYEKYFFIAPQDEELQRVLVQGYFRMGVPEKGIAILEGLQSRSDDPELLGKLVEYYRSRRLYNEAAIAHFRRWAVDHADDRDLWLTIAEYYALRQDTSAEALVYYRRVLGEPRDDLGFRQLMARHYLGKKQWDDAIELLEPLRQQGLFLCDTLLAYARAKAETQALDIGSIAIYERAIAEGSRSRLIYETLCRAYIENDRLDIRAFQHFEATIGLHPNTPWGHFGLARYYLKLGEASIAYQYAIRHVRLCSQDAAGHKAAGSALARALTGEALEALDELLDDVALQILLAAFDEEPDEARLLVPLGRRLFAREGYHREKQRVFEHLRRHFPADPVVLGVLMEVYAAQGDLVRQQDVQHHLAFAGLAVEPRSEIGDDARSCEAFIQAALKSLVTHLEKKKPLLSDEERILHIAVQRNLATQETFRRLALLAADRNEFGAQTIELYERALGENPELIALHHLLMRSYTAIGEYRRVLRHATDILLERPYDPIVLALTIECLMNNGAFDPDLHDLLRMQYENRLSDSRVTLAYALSCLRAELYDRESSVVYERAIAHADAQQTLILETALARCLELLGEHDKAVVVYDSIIAHMPDDLEIIRRLALAQLRGGQDNDEEQQSMIRALELAPYDEEFYFMVCELYIDRGQRLLAQYAIDRIMRENPLGIDRLEPLLEKARELRLGGPPLTVQLAEYAFLKGKKERTKQLMSELGLNLHPRHARAAIELYNIMLVQDPDDLQVLQSRGWMHVAAGELALGVEDLTIYWERAGLRRPLPDRFIEVINRYLEGTRVVPSRLLILLAKSFYQSGRFQEAIRLGRIVLCRKRAHPEMLWTLARSYYHLDRREAAHRALAGLPRTPEAVTLLYRLACSHQRDGEIDEALALFNEILMVDRQFADVGERAYHLERRRVLHAAGEDRRRRDVASRFGARAQHRYELVREIDRTPLTVTYKAYDKEHDKVVALTILSVEFSQSAEAAKTFLDEARRLLQLSHPHLLAVTDVYSGSGVKYMCTEYAERPFQLVIKGDRERSALGRLLAALTQISEGLHAAHANRCVHGGLSPRNILVDHLNVLKVGGFGAGRVAGLDAVLSPGLRAFDEAFAAPELRSGECASVRSDVYAFGATALALIAGRAPTVPPRDSNGRASAAAPFAFDFDTVPPELDLLLRSCLETSVHSRPIDMLTVTRALRKIAAAMSYS